MFFVVTMILFHYFAAHNGLISTLQMNTFIHVGHKQTSRLC